MVFFPVYLLVGVTAMMLLLTVFYSIPELDISNFFLMSCSAGKINGAGNMTNITNSNNVEQENNSNTSTAVDPERIRLKTPGKAAVPRYTQHLGGHNETTGVRVLSLLK
jgi:hypothetical protein